MSSDIRNATHVDVEAEVRYWEDTEVDGIVDETGSLIPGRIGDLWKIRIDLAAGRIEEWPSGTQASIHYKVCDQGEYWLSGRDGIRLAKWKGHYVPDDMLCHGDEGYGDYIIMTVSADGTIVDYRKPEIDVSRWLPI